MEVSGIVFRRVPFISGAGIDAQYSKSSFSGVSVDGGGNRFSTLADLRLLGSRDSRVAVRPRKLAGFHDGSHLKYYCESPTCGAKKDKVSTKKKLKLLKALSKDLSIFSDLGFGENSDQGLVGEVKGKMLGVSYKFIDFSFRFFLCSFLLVLLFLFFSMDLEDLPQFFLHFQDS